jgi:serine/threonine protein kinase
MEYCHNGELYTHIVNNGPMGELQVARVFHQILAALLYLKRLGLSHRDIKPENILFDKNWNVKLVDFGFGCKTFGIDGQFRTTFCGTPSYTPPEVLLKTSYNPELMDVWSLGVTVYAMLTG